MTKLWPHHSAVKLVKDWLAEGMQINHTFRKLKEQAVARLPADLSVESTKSLLAPTASAE